MTIRLNRIAAFRRSTAGASAVEFALAAPILFLLMFGIIEFGRAWWTKNSLQYAVERAARYAVICDSNDPSTCPPSDSLVQTFASNQVNGQSVSSSQFQVTHPQLSSGQNVVCVGYSYSYAPWFVGEFAPLTGTMNFTGTSCRATAH
jgi:Flp pilus assembly protein TadG